MADLTELLARCEAATGPDRDIDFALQVVSNGGDPTDYVVDPRWQHLLPQYTTSIDAALWLVERMLPGWHWMKPFAEENYIRLYEPKPNYPQGVGAHPTSLPLAIIIALLRSLAKAPTP